MKEWSMSKDAGEALSVCLAGGEDDVAQLYAKDGYLARDFAFDPALIDAAAADTRAIAATGRRRAQDLWRTSSAVRALACDRGVLAFLSELYRRRAFPFQTLNFVKGSEQKPHADTIHFSSAPERFMCGLWIALEDVDEENGPLVYYPGSHRLPLIDLHGIGGADYVADYEPYLMRQLAEGGFEKKTAPLKKGDCFIWSANLCHGGAPIVDQERTRLSLVTHYYFEDCCYTTPLRSAPDRPHIREVYDISRNAFVKQYAGGARVRPALPVALAARMRNLLRLAPVS